MAITTKDIKQLAYKAGYVLGRLTTDVKIPNGFVGVIAVAPTAPDPNVIENDFAKDMEAQALKDLKANYRVVLEWVDHAPPFVNFMFTVIDLELDAASSDYLGLDEEGQQTVKKPLPRLGSVALSDNGFTGQIVAYSRDVPRLVRVRWHRFGMQAKEFFTWENPQNINIVTDPIPNQWWPRPGEFVLGNVPSVNVGTPVREFSVQELTPDDKDWREIVDGEQVSRFPSALAPSVRPDGHPWDNGLHRCACGCNGTCRNYFCAGHDARCWGLLQRKKAGKEPTWTPTARLIEYVESKDKWFNEFGNFIQEFKPGGKYNPIKDNSL